MNIKQVILFLLVLLILLILGTLPLWWEDMAPSIFGFPAYLVEEINSYIDAIEWLFNKIFS